MRHLFLLVLVLMLAACGSGTASAPAPTQATSAPPKATEVPKATDAPKPAAQPTAAPKPTDAPKPAPTQAPTPKATDVPKAAAIGKVGEAIEVNGIRLTIHKAERKADLSQFQKAKESRAFIVVEATIENVGQNEHSANMFSFKLRDADGQSYNQTAGQADPLQLAQLVKGDKARGTIAFDIKADAKGLVLIYDTTPLANAAQQIRVDLGM